MDTSTLFKSYKNLMLWHALKIIGDPQDAQDIVQDVFEKILVLQPSNINKTYLLNAVKNQCIDLMRESRTRSMYYQNYSVTLFGVDYIWSKDHLVQKKIEQLPDKAKDIFIKYFFEDKDCKEIAQETGMNPSTIRSHKNNVIKYLNKFV